MSRYLLKVPVNSRDFLFIDKTEHFIYISMLTLTQGNTDDVIVVTLTELSLLTNPYYLFVFTQLTTKQQVAFIKGPDDDESDYPERYNQYTIDTAVLFAGVQHGQWLYEVYEQESSSNTNPAGLNMVETGKMKLLPAEGFEYAYYDSTTTYNAYNG